MHPGPRATTSLWLKDYVPGWMTKIFAAALGCTSGAIAARARKLLRTIGVEDPELEDLRSEVVGRGRDIMALARAVHETDGPYLWTRVDDERLRAPGRHR